MKPPVPCDESSRLEALAAYGILDTAPEVGFEHITSLATRMFKVPIAAVTLVDADRQWSKSVRGWAVRETPREHSFCAHAMTRTDVMVVPDATLDPRFEKNPLVTGEPFIRFYAGAPLRTPEGHPLGALCLIDHHPREFGPSDQKVLAQLASLTEDELLLRRVGKELSEERARRPVPPVASGQEGLPAPADPGGSQEGGQVQRIVTQSSDAIFVYDLEGRFVDVNAAACRLVGYERDELLCLRVSDIEATFDPVKGPQRWRQLAANEAVTMEGFTQRKEGVVFPTEARVSMVETEEGVRLLALVRDTTDRKQAERLLRARALQQQAVAALGATALRGAELGALFDEAVRSIGEVLGVEICRVLEHVPARRALVTRAGLNVPVGEIGAVTASDDPRSVAGQVLQTGNPVIIRNAVHEKRFKIASWLHSSGAVSGLSVSVGGDDTQVPTFGVLAVYTLQEREFTSDDVYFVQAAANVLASAVARQQGEDKLRAVEARYQRIAANTPGVVYQYLQQPDGTVTIPFISESCRALYGREPEEIQEHPELMIATVHPEDRESFVEAIRAAKQDLVAVYWQGRHVLPGGETRWVRFDSRPERLPDGSVMCDGIIIDVTAEEQRKAALRESEERFRRAIVHSPFPVMLHTDDGEVVQVNDAWTHLTGYYPDELTSIEAWLERAYPAEEKKEEVWRFIARIREHIGAIQFPASAIRCADGEIRIWDFSCANLGRLSDGRWLHIASATDVTERHSIEAALRAAKEEAERANDAKSEFLSRMSHELRTPLNAILGFGQLLEMSRLDEQDTLSVSHILKGGRHLLSLVDDVLDLARVEAGELSLALTVVPLDKLAQECAGFVARMAQARQITCTVVVSVACHLLARADEHRLKQVLLNLLSNAIKYNREGGEVSIDCEERPPDRVRLTITDTGPGISEEGLGRLFVPFERLGQEFGEVEGAGLGLVVAKQLMEAMGGTMGVESRLGQGSKFWVELPSVQEASTPGEETLPAGDASADAPGERLCATVLYIEDNVSNVQVIKTVMERLRPQWNFLSARDGQSGLRQAREQGPDVILLDLQLPGMNGDAVLAELRADGRTRDIPVLLLSADATVHSRERLLALGANDYLSKPFNVAKLLVKLDLLLTSGMVER